MSSLKTYKFSELYKMSSGISSKPEQAGHGSPFLSFGTIFNNYFLPNELSDYMNTSKEQQENYSIRKGDVFLTRTSEVIDELAMSSVSLKDYPEATFSGFAKRLRPIQKDITYDKFMGFYLRSEYFRKLINNNAIMTLRASFNENIFSYLKIHLPDYQTQVKIGDFLYKLEEKKILSDKINKELEDLAKTIYNYWFVQFDFPNEHGEPYKTSGGKMIWNESLKREIPEGWGVGKVGELLNTILGGTPSTKIKEYWENGNINWLSSGEMAQFPVVKANAKITEEAVSNSATKLMPKGSVAISITRYIRPTILGIDSCANQSVVGILESDVFQSSYLYPYFQNQVIKYLTVRTGAMQPHINKDTIDKSLIIVPKKEVLSSYYSLVNPMYKKIINNSFQMQELSELRDWLLPLLMNGQVQME